MITCCEIALTLSITNIITLAIFANYYIRLKNLALELKKKNGYEQHQINEIKQEIQKLKNYENN